MHYERRKPQKSFEFRYSEISIYNYLWQIGLIPGLQTILPSGILGEIDIELNEKLNLLFFTENVIIYSNI